MITNYYRSFGSKVFDALLELKSNPNSNLIEKRLVYLNTQTQEILIRFFKSFAISTNEALLKTLSEIHPTQYKHWALAVFLDESVFTNNTLNLGEHLNHILMFKSSFREKYGFSMRKPTNWEPFMILFQFYSLNELGKSKDLDQNQLFHKLKSIFISVNIDPESRVSNPLWNLNFKWHIYISTPKKAPS